MTSYGWRTIALKKLNAVYVDVNGVDTSDTGLLYNRDRSMVKPTSCSSTNCKLVAFLGYSKSSQVSYAVAYNEISTSSGVGDKGYIVGYE